MADAAGLRFFVVEHPNQLKDKEQMRANRQHVMLDYLYKERHRPPGKNASNDTASLPSRKRKQQKAPAPMWVNSTVVPPSQIFHPPPLTPAPSTRSSTTPQNGPACDQVPKANRGRKRSSISSPAVVRKVQNSPRNMPPLVPGMGGRFDNSVYLQMEPNDVPFDVPRFNGRLNPFQTWPAFDDPSIDVSELKYKCSRRFGSRSIATTWVPILLRSRHAFLSTICISSAHDDIMNRAYRPDHESVARETTERLKVRQGVITMINDSLNDPVLRTADATVVAVLHVLYSEIMGGNDQALRAHQNGLHDMVISRGGMEVVAQNQQLAVILTITMYFIAALREMPPHRDFVDYATTLDMAIPTDTRPIPESPLYCQPGGFRNLDRVLANQRETRDLLHALRDLSQIFYIENAKKSALKAPIDDPSYLARQSVANLRDRVFAFRPAIDRDGFDDMNQRYTFEALRLAALVYAHALANKISLSKAAAQLNPGTTPGWTPRSLTPDSGTTDYLGDSMHVRIKWALMRTDTSDCWGHMAGVLFWIALVACAAANPGALSNEEREGSDEDARKWLSAVAVRCTILLSFEFGTAMLETLKRMVAIEDLLAADAELVRLPSRGDVFWERETVGNRVVHGPDQAQRGFADFAWEFAGGGWSE